MSPTEPYPCLIRAARQEDAQLVRELIEPFVVRQILLPRTLEEFDQLLSNGFVAELEGRIIGFAALEVYSKKLAEIRSLCVADGYQRHGVGKMLVAACVQSARDRNIFEVMAVTSSEEFFRVCGFDFTLPGEKKAFFMQTREHY